MLLGIGTDAYAQMSLGSLKNAVKKAAEKAVSSTVETVEEKSESSKPTTALEALQAGAQSQSTAKPSEAVNRQPVHKVPCPAIMAKDDGWDHPAARQYIDRLGHITNSGTVEALRDSLRARVHEDSLEIERLRPEKLQMSLAEDMAFDELENEIKRYNTFLSCLGDYTTRLYFSGATDIDHGSADIDYISVRLEKTTVYAKYSSDKNWYFYSMSNDKVFLEDEDMEYVKADQMRYNYISKILLAGQKSRELRDVALKAGFSSSILLKAMKNNSVDNIEYHPYPKGGPLNGLAGKALASAKNNSSYTEAIAVVIDAPSWTVDYDALGNPIRRKAGGWVIKNTKYGKKACRAQFSEDYLGGGSYGEIKLYGIGGDQHFVK